MGKRRRSPRGPAATTAAGAAGGDVSTSGQPVADARAPASRRPAGSSRAGGRESASDSASPGRDTSRASQRTSATGADESERPRFWFGFEVSWAKLAIGRVLFFGLLAMDAVLAIRHAPRYGTGAFNVAQIPLLDGLGPTRASYAVSQLGLAFLFTLAACNVGTRVVVPICAAVYGWLYFGSQLDSYQHHYLVVLLLVIASAIPWRRPPDARPDMPVRSWALRLFLVQLAILYGWAAISKMSPAWVDGRTLGKQLVAAPAVRGLIDATIGIAATSVLVLVTELAIAATIWWKRAWPFVAPVGILLHLGIVFAKFEIGLFAWLMIGIYAFVVPDAIWIGLARLVPRLPRPTLAPKTSVIVGGVLGLAAVGVAAATRLPYATQVAAIVIGVAIGLSVARANIVRLGAACLAAAALVFAVDRASDVAFDYYKFWGGSSRRLGDVASAERAYRGMIAIAPDDDTGYYQLGRVLIDRDAPTALEHLHRAQHLAPRKARAYVIEAQWLAQQGRTAEAIEKAREATYADPSSTDARGLLDRLTNKPAGNAPAAPTDD